MFNLIFESDPIDYLMPDETPITLFPGLTYNAYLTTPPRIYGEEVYNVFGLFVMENKTPNGPTTIRMIGDTNMTHWPSYEIKGWEWDSYTGEYRGQVPGTSSLSLGQMNQSADGSIWQEDTGASGDLFEIDPVTMAPTGETLLNTTFGMIGLRAALVDRGQNLLICKADSGNTIKVFNYTTGALIRTISVSGSPKQIVSEDSTRCYVLCTNDMLNLVDFSTGVVISTLRSPITNNTNLVIAYDRYYRRLLFWNDTPEAVDGAATSTIRGYYPVPKSVGLMNPIPLRSPRKNRTIPVLTKVYGDVGEPLSGVNIVATPSANATLSGPPGISDTHGEAIINVTCLDDNPITLGIEAQVL